MRDAFLPFSPLAIGEEEVDAVVEVLRSGWLTTGPKANELERAFAEKVGAAGALATSSCTGALHTALAVLGVGPGDEVITTPITFPSTVNVIELLGATPVLVDVELDTLNIDPDLVAEAVGDRTKAILPVHHAGHPVELDPLLELAADGGIALVEDAAHAFPAAYRGRSVGSGANLVAFSFYATKNLTTGEGGMLTGAPELVDDARSLVLHGLSRDAWRRYESGGNWRYEVSRPGFKYNLPDVLAAIGLAQLAKIDAFQARRRAIVDAYTGAFDGHDCLEVPIARPHVEHAWHLYMLRLRLETLSIDRDRFIREMTQRNIGTSVHFIPIHQHAYYRDRYGWKPADLPVASSEFERLVSLPLTPALSDVDVGDVIEAILDVCDAFRR